MGKTGGTGTVRGGGQELGPCMEIQNVPEPRVTCPWSQLREQEVERWRLIVSAAWWELAPLQFRIPSELVHEGPRQSSIQKVCLLETSVLYIAWNSIQGYILYASCL